MFFSSIVNKVEISDVKHNQPLLKRGEKNLELIRLPD